MHKRSYHEYLHDQPAILLSTTFSAGMLQAEAQYYSKRQRVAGLTDAEVNYR